PGHELVLRAGVIRTKPYIALFGKRDPQHKTNDKCHSENVIPAKIQCNPVYGALHCDSRVIRNNDSPDGKRKNNHRRDNEYAQVNMGSGSINHFLRALAQIVARDGGIIIVAFMPTACAAKAGALQGWRWSCLCLCRLTG